MPQPSIQFDRVTGDVRGATPRETGSSVICVEQGNDSTHAVSHDILEHFEPLTQLSTLDRIKVASRVDYNVFATSSAFWEQRIDGLNSGNTRRAMAQ